MVSYNPPGHTTRKGRDFFKRSMGQHRQDGNFQFRAVVPRCLREPIPLCSSSPGGITTSIANASALDNHQPGETHEKWRWVEWGGGGGGGPGQLSAKVTLPPDAATKGWTFTNNGMSTKQPEPNIHPAGMT